MMPELTKEKFYEMYAGKETIARSSMKILGKLNESRPIDGFEFLKVKNISENEVEFYGRNKDREYSYSFSTSLLYDDTELKLLKSRNKISVVLNENIMCTPFQIPILRPDGTFIVDYRSEGGTKHLLLSESEITLEDFVDGLYYFHKPNMNSHQKEKYDEFKSRLKEDKLRKSICEKLNLDVDSVILMRREGPYRSLHLSKLVLYDENSFSIYKYISSGKIQS